MLQPDTAVTRTVSFMTDVAPIFQASCATGGTSCHSDAGKMPNGFPLVLGGAASVTPGMIVTNLVNVKSGEDPSLNLVTPNDPVSSYLMHKLDGDQCGFATACNAGLLGAAYPNCGVFMPNAIPPMTTSSPLTGPQRETVRAWIKQGAMNN
jgi:hypothetical protein